MWETDTEWIETVATRYDRFTGDIFVEISDPRCRFTGLWLARSDVEILANP